MTSEKIVRTALALCLLISLLAYHLINVLIKPSSSQAILDTLKIAQIAAAGILFFLLVYNKAITWIFLRDKFIAGHYVGQSVAYRDASGEEPKPHIEVFTVTQNLFEAQISGLSFHRDTERFISRWTGRLFRVENNAFYFAIELSTEKTEFGVIQASFEKTGMHGFYYSGEPKTKHAFSFSAKKIDKKAKQELVSRLTQHNVDMIPEAIISDKQ